MEAPSLAGTALHDWYHVCAFFSSREEEYDTLCPFFKEGLEWGEKIVHSVNPTLVADHLCRLQAHGIDSMRCLESAQLQVFGWDDLYVQNGAFDAARVLSTVQEAVDRARTSGYPRVRLMGNMGWAFDGTPGVEQLLEYEARVNDVLARDRLPAICVYEVGRLSGTLIMDIVRSHPLTLIGGVLYENPFYTPAEILLRELRGRAASGRASGAPDPDVG